MYMDKVVNSGRQGANEDQPVELQSGRILIVDDDVDSALAVSTMFKKLGCVTDCALSFQEAKSKMNDRNIDIIVLDWCLDQGVRADELLNKILKVRTRFFSEDEYKKPVVVTFSSLPASNINWVQSAHFEYFGHWMKPLSHRDLVQESLQLLRYAGL